MSAKLVYRLTKEELLKLKEVLTEASLAHEANGNPYVHVLKAKNRCTIRSIPWRIYDRLSKVKPDAFSRLSKSVVENFVDLEL